MLHEMGLQVTSIEKKGNIKDYIQPYQWRIIRFYNKSIHYLFILEKSAKIRQRVMSKTHSRTLTSISVHQQEQEKQERGLPISGICHTLDVGESTSTRDRNLEIDRLSAS